jgi:hypothetical protein
MCGCVVVSCRGSFWLNLPHVWAQPGLLHARMNGVRLGDSRMGVTVLLQHVHACHDRVYTSGWCPQNRRIDEREHDRGWGR